MKEETRLNIVAVRFISMSMLICKPLIFTSIGGATTGNCG